MLSEIPPPVYLANRGFHSGSGGWGSWLDWAGLPNVEEVVGPDCMLCPDVLRDIEDADWPNIVSRDMQTRYFTDLNQLLRRLPDVVEINILGLYRNPCVHIATPPSVSSFDFLGYELIEEQTHISALTNCGGFSGVFAPEELNPFGLVSDFVRASSMRRKLRVAYPEEPHANCELYAVWRMNHSSN